MTEPIWGFLMGVAELDGDAGTFFATTVARILAERRTPLTVATLLNLLEDARSAMPIDEAIELLRGSGLLSAVNEPASDRFRIGGAELDLDDLAAALRSAPVGAVLDVWNIGAIVDRSRNWAEELAEVVRVQRLNGVPTFWQCPPEVSMPAAHQPLASDIGSMTSLDLLALWAATSLPSSGVPTEGLEWLLECSLGLQEVADSPFTGGLHLRQFDDDFVYNFDPVRGAFPTLDATANACSAWLQMLGCNALPAQLAENTEAAVVRGLDFVIRAQRLDGSWAIADGRRLAALPPSALSIRFAVLALSDAVLASSLPVGLRERADHALSKAARYLARTTEDGLPIWNQNFSNGGLGSRRLETTALLTEPAQRLADWLPTDLIDAVVQFVWDEFQARPSRVLQADFRVPTWDGVSGEVQGWELPLDSIVATAVASQRPLIAEDIEALSAALSEVVRTETHGHWYDLGGLASGKRRAFPSNSLLNVRALLAWCAAGHRRLHELVADVGRKTVSRTNPPLASGLPLAPQRTDP